MIDRDTLHAATAAVCIANGIFSPFLAVAAPIAAGLMPEMFPRNASWIFFFGSILLATATLLVSGIPAALYERLVDDQPQNVTAAWIWLAGAVVLSIPAFLVIASL